MPVAAINSSYAALAGTLVGSAAGILAIGGAARTTWRRTLGRRADRYARLSRLGTGAHLSFFVAVLGEPPAMRNSIIKDDYVEWVSPEDDDLDPSIDDHARLITRRFEISTFVDRDYYVQTISDDDETVLAFSVTTRRRRFQPVYNVHPKPSLIARWRWRRRWGEPYRPLVNIKLAKTTFADLDARRSDEFVVPHFRVAAGAHNHAYSEIAYHGNPGNYQWFAWTASDVARHANFGSAMQVLQEVGGEEWPNRSSDNGHREWRDMAHTQQFRRETIITTYTVIHPRLSLRNYPLPRFGPHENDVRLLP